MPGDGYHFVDHFVDHVDHFVDHVDHSKNRVVYDPCTMYLLIALLLPLSQ